MKEYYTGIKKKIRGWKRRVRQVEEWGEDIKEPIIDWFIQPTTRDIYRRCNISPFYNATKRHPPIWFYKIIIEQFIVAYKHWKQKFDELGVPYDLQLLIYDPAYIKSEIACWKVGELNQRIKYSWESSTIKAFPYKTLGSKLYNLHDFEWILADDEHVHFESDFEYADFTAEELLNEGNIKKVQGDDEVYYSYRHGDIWIGRYKHM